MLFPREMFEVFLKFAAMQDAMENKKREAEELFKKQMSMSMNNSSFCIIL